MVILVRFVATSLPVDATASAALELLEVIPVGKPRGRSGKRKESMAVSSGLGWLCPSMTRRRQRR
jgi:hypothetical protein